jgi:hypothetical protein
MLVEPDAILSLQRIQRVKSEIISVLFVRAHQLIEVAKLFPASSCFYVRTAALGRPVEQSSALKFETLSAEQSALHESASSPYLTVLPFY